VAVCLVCNVKTVYAEFAVTTAIMYPACGVWVAGVNEDYKYSILAWLWFYRSIISKAGCALGLNQWGSMGLNGLMGGVK
jgi:hypothetical protein